MAMTMQRYTRQYGTHTGELSDKQVLEMWAKWGADAPALQGVPGEQWDRVLKMINMIEAAKRVKCPLRRLLFQPEFFGAYRRYGASGTTRERYHVA